MVDAATLRILNRGPEYLRSRMLNRDGGFIQRRRTKSVADELAESRPQYIRKLSIQKSHDQEARSHDQEARSHDQEQRGTLQEQENFSTEEDEDRISSNPDPAEESRMEKSGARPPTYKVLPRRQDSLPMRSTEAGSRDALQRIASMDKVLNPESGVEENPEPVFPLARESSFTRSRPKIPSIASLEHGAGDHAGDGGAGSDTDKRSTASSSQHHKLDGGGGGVGGSGAVVRRRHRKMISRSRSDLTKRLSNSSELSELGLRLSRNSADLEKFFNEMGLEREILQPMLNSQCTSGAQFPSLYESVSCLAASPDNHSLASSIGSNSDFPPHPPRPPFHHQGAAGGVSGGGGGGDEARSLDTMSVVERNARIIKWLGGVKKAAGSASD